MTCAKETLQLSCAANELIVIEDIFYGRRENGPRCGLFYSVLPAEVKKNVTFQKDPRQLDTSDTWEWGALAVSSTNEIFVTDERNKRIQVFSMKGVFIHSFSTRDLKPVAISTGRNDTLWVILEGYDIQQHSKEGHVLAKFTCSSTSKEIIYGIAWHELSDRIILTQGAWPTEIVWLSPTYTTTPTSATCNLNRLSGTGSDEISNKQSITIDMKGNIYVIDKYEARILKYGENGVYLTSFGSPGSGAGNLNNPSGICVDSLGRVIVADAGNSRVEMFTAKGEHIRTVAYMQKPRHVATGGEGQLVVLNQESFVTIFPKY
ncbi:PREDICTED: tripartite motif-containing protein 3-like [Branchiostoma belcheri]|uniref:Tripartite motif-containing protein 3-like n=1 Tax=Branchiostoma belcheri TaxID=7741 RepID=A0A6P4Z421_BRABE|nr:PREDICTED: tripartite motif-containing protein 3-like [Branchiostoma belcheri]